jgi:hypothetical protein
VPSTKLLYGASDAMPACPGSYAIVNLKIDNILRISQRGTRLFPVQRKKITRSQNWSSLPPKRRRPGVNRVRVWTVVKLYSARNCSRVAKSFLPPKIAALDNAGVEIVTICDQAGKHVCWYGDVVRCIKPNESMSQMSGFHGFETELNHKLRRSPRW